MELVLRYTRLHYTSRDSRPCRPEGRNRSCGKHTLMRVIMRERNEYLCSCRIYIQTEGRGKQSTTKLTISLPEGDTHYGDKNIEKEDSKVAGKAQYGGEFCKPSNRKTRARGLLQIQRLIWDTQRIQGSPGPHSKILSKQTSKSAGGGIMCCTQYRGSEQEPQRRLKTLRQHCEDYSQAV